MVIHICGRATESADSKQKLEFAKMLTDRLREKAKTAIYPMRLSDRTKGRSQNTKPIALRPKIHSIPTAHRRETPPQAIANQTTNSPVRSAPANLEPPTTATNHPKFEREKQHLSNRASDPIRSKSRSPLHTSAPATP